MDKRKTLYILDGYSLVYRSYFAFIRNPLFSPDGHNSSAVFGFFRTLLNFLNTYKAEYFCVSLDPKGPTFRHERYPQYKANREKAPDDLHAQIPVIENILSEMNIPVARVDRYEADDIMASYTRICPPLGFECAVITGDKDLLQLVQEGARYLKPDKSGYLEMDNKRIMEEWGVESFQILDYLSLTGDSSDNVPGVAGIGPKTASALLAEYRTLEGVYENLERLSAGQRKKLEEGRESAFMSRELISLCHDVPGLPEPEYYRLKACDNARVEALFLAEGAKSLVQQLNSLTDRPVAGIGGNDLFEKRQGQKGIPETFHAPVIHEGGTTDNDPGVYSAVTDLNDLVSLMKKLSSAGTIAVDVETDNIYPVLARPVGFCFSYECGTGFYVPVRCSGTDCLPEDSLRSEMTKLFSTPGLKVVGQNIKYDYKVLKRWGIDIGPLLHFDTMIAAWLLDTSANSYGMDDLAEKHLGYRTLHFSEIVEKGKTFDTVPIEKAVLYAAEDADITFRLFRHYREWLEKSGYDRLFYDLEMPLVRILGDMELAGISLDTEKLKKFGVELERDLSRTEQEIYTLCGREFNINSPKQLQEILFVERKLTPVKKTRTGYSTDVSVLEALAVEDPVPEKILEHRSLSKLKSTYVDVLPDIVNPETRRIHTSFNVTGTATGRLSSTNPNLQNIPVKTDAGRKIRDAFIPRKGCRFLSADYAQIELVVFAHLSEDPGLRKAFLEGSDIHAQTASLIFDLPVEMVGPDQRRIAKTINFGVIYGMSAFRLANELKIPRKHAAAFIDAYFDRYGRVRDFMNRVIGEAENSGYSTTLLGRKRKIPGINSRNKTEKMAAERIAVNTPVQGSAADIVKLAMIAVDRELVSGGFASRMLLQVHDELIFEVPEEEVAAMEKMVKKVMEGVVKLSVPLRASIETGMSWGQMH